ncbi:hypothetical protein BGZ54_009859 [Gamsiella multidivaricata]|nr:hypothetical protein BGZ54_009859 [Gamsiella multidivaricata]
MGEIFPNVTVLELLGEIELEGDPPERNRTARGSAQKESTIVVDDTAASMIPVVLGCRPRTPVVQETMERHARKLEGLYLSYGGMSREVMLPSLPECTSASSASSSLLPLLPPSRHSFTSQLSSLTTIDN